MKHPLLKAGRAGATGESRKAQFVLVACTQTYEQRYEGIDTTEKGKGVKWEGAIITQELYDSQGRNKKFIPVIFTPKYENHIPTILRGATNYIPNTEKGYESLYRHLTNQPLIEKPVLGKLKSLPSRPRIQDFRTTAWNVPFPRNPFFTGLEQVFEKLHEALRSGKIQAINGLGSMGKTQTAIQNVSHAR